MKFVFLYGERSVHVNPILLVVIVCKYLLQVYPTAWTHANLC